MDAPAPNLSHLEAADHLPVDAPHTIPGRRARVMVRFPDFDDYQYYENALMSCTHNPQEAYVPCTFPYKRKRTLAGYVEICHVLELVEQQQELDQDDMYYFEMTKRRVAIKACLADNMRKLRRKGCQEDPLREIGIMQLLGTDLPNVGTCTEVLHVAYDGSYHIILPFFGGGDLRGYFDSRPNWTEAEAKGLFRDIMRGLMVLHDHGICHHDLSPENVMIHKGVAYIIDFGMALRVPRTLYGRASLIKPDGDYGKLPYMAPEVYRQTVVYDSEAIDVWSAGIILWCMVSGLGSYDRPENSDPVFKAMTRFLPKACRVWGVQLSDDCLDLLQKMIQVDGTMRLTIDEVMEHPWMRQD